MAFKYPPLPATDGLRVLTLQPGEFWAPLVGVLTAVPFSEKPRYVALSYTWSDPDPDHAEIPAMPLKQEAADQQGESPEQPPPYPGGLSKPASPKAREESHIVLNGTPLPLFHNVCLALRFVRSTTHSVAIWVDAICIDQTSIFERNAQVALMAFIFTRATAVISWLGVPSRDELKVYLGKIGLKHEEQMAAAWEVGQARHMAEELTELPRRRTAGEGILTATTLGGPEKVGAGKLLLRDQEPLQRVVSNPYWSRLWVVQEVCLPRHLYFLFGAELFTEEVAQMQKKPVPMERLLEARRNRFSDAMRLETLIERFMESGCAEVRDRVFGLIGLANDVDSFALDIPEITSEPLLASDQTGRAPRFARRPNLKLNPGSRDGGRGGPVTRTDSYGGSDASVAGDTSDALLGKGKVLANKPRSTFGSLLGGGIATMAGGASKKAARVAIADDHYGGLARSPRDARSASSSSTSTRGRGLLEIDYRRPFYEIWSDVVSFVHFRAKPQTDLGEDELDDERSIRVVRFGGVLQKTLQGKVESERRDLESEGLFDPNPTMILAKGYVAGKIVYMGPTYREFVGSYRDQQRWLGSWNTHYEGSAHLEMLRKMEEAYSAKILEYQDEDLARIRRLHSPETKCWHAPGRDTPRGGLPLLPESDTDGDAPMGTSEHDPIRFLGTDLCMGLAPTAARVGDLVVRFWNCDAAIVVRRSQSIIEREQDGVYWLVGRADVAEAWDRRDGVDRAAQEKMRVIYRPEPTTKAVYVAMDFDTLQKVSAAIEI